LPIYDKTDITIRKRLMLGGIRDILISLRLRTQTSSSARLVTAASGYFG